MKETTAGEQKNALSGGGTPDRAKDEQTQNTSVPGLIIPDGRAEIKEEMP